jgi:AraC-like DNA-binding protein
MGNSRTIQAERLRPGDRNSTSVPLSWPALVAAGNTIALRSRTFFAPETGRRERSDRLAASVVRRDWSYELASVGQRFVGLVLDVDGPGYLEALAWLAQQVPEPASRAECLQLHDRLADLALRSSEHFHRTYHAVAGSALCAALPDHGHRSIWTVRDRDPRALLQDFGAAFLASFDASHPWPPAVRVAARLRTEFQRAVRLDQMARAVGVSRTALVRAFRARYGLSIGEYARKVRLGWAVGQLRDRNLSVDAVARLAGYRRTASLNHALHRVLPDLTPTRLRNLSSAECEAVVLPAVQVPFLAGRSGGPAS